MANVLNTDLVGKVCVVTGAGGAICGMLSERLAAAGCKVAALNRSEDSAQRVVDSITAAGGIAKAYKVNVLEKESLEDAHAKILADFGPCDVLINGAGGNDPQATTGDEFYGDVEGCKTFFDLERQGIDLVFNLNWVGTLLPTQVFAQDMVGRDGNIINIASMNAFRPLTKIPAYSSAKAAVVNLTQWLAVYFAKSKIRVNAIAPGFFAGKQNRALLFNTDGTPTERTGKILANTPMGRLGELEEIAGAVLFLINNRAASFITGVCIPIDGGFSAYSGV